MTERYQFRDADTDELMHEIFNSDERLEAREYKTVVALDKLSSISLEQAHLIMHVFFVDKDASLADKVKMVAEVLIAGPDLGEDYPEPEMLEAKIAEVRLVFDSLTEVQPTQH
ncbi:MAG: hypothetical protein ACRBBJ_06135 [Rhodomicrobiaceae bacterium]